MEKYAKIIILGLLWLFPSAAFPESSGAHAGGLRADSILPDYRLRTPDAGTMESYRDDAAFRYERKESDAPYWLEKFMNWLAGLFKFRSVDAGPVSVWDIVFKVSAVLLIVFLIYKLVRAKYRLPGGMREKRFLSGEAETPLESVDTVSYPLLLEKAVAMKNYSLAVRVHYLYILYLLDQKGIIKQNKYKTNITYIYEIGNRAIRPVFCELSRIFDYVCYGEFEVSESVFLRVDEEFKAFQKEISDEV